MPPIQDPPPWQLGRPWFRSVDDQIKAATAEAFARGYEVGMDAGFREGHAAAMEEAHDADRERDWLD